MWSYSAVFLQEIHCYGVSLQHTAKSLKGNDENMQNHFLGGEIELGN